MDELLAFLRDNATKLANQEAVDAMGDKLNTIIAALESHEASATELARLTARVAELEGQLAERDTALTAATTEVTAANATITELNAAVTERDTALATYREVEAAAAVAATLQARIAELPAAYLAAHNALPDARRLEIETRWAAKTDEEWKEVLETASIVPTVQRSYLRRSAEEGTLPVGGAGSTNGASRLKRFLGR